jgi:hypothetical protein
MAAWARKPRQLWRPPPEAARDAAVRIAQEAAMHLRVSISVFLVLGFSALTLGSDAGARCGVERWSVKTGTDADIAALNLANSVSTSIAALDAIPQPASGTIPPNNRISPAETTVWRIQATLVEFKFENDPNTGDSDYHLVLRDGSGNTLIAEIPSPSCVDPHSPFLNGIQQARQEMDSRFTASSSFKPVGLPVEVTGVGMFDFPHGQHGHAPNFIEIHPVLSLQFNPGPTPSPTPQPTPQPTPLPTPGSNLLVDGGFEDAADWGTSAPGWQSNSTMDNPAIIAGGSFPHSGENYAFLGNDNDVDVSLEQAVTLPASGHAQLTFAVNVVTKERSNAAAHDELKVEVRNSSGSVLATVLVLSNRDATSSSNTRGNYFEPAAIDLSSFAGQSVTLAFHVTTNGARPTVFRIDDVVLKTVP